MNTYDERADRWIQRGTKTVIVLGIATVIFAYALVSCDIYKRHSASESPQSETKITRLDDLGEVPN